MQTTPRTAPCNRRAPSAALPRQNAQATRHPTRQLTVDHELGKHLVGRRVHAPGQLRVALPPAGQLGEAGPQVDDGQAEVGADAAHGGRVRARVLGGAAHGVALGGVDGALRALVDGRRGDEDERGRVGDHRGVLGQRDEVLLEDGEVDAVVAFGEAGAAVVGAEEDCLLGVRCEKMPRGGPTIRRTRACSGAGRMCSRTMRAWSVLYPLCRVNEVG